MLVIITRDGAETIDVGQAPMRRKRTEVVRGRSSRRARSPAPPVRLAHVQSTHWRLRIQRSAMNPDCVARAPKAVRWRQLRHARADKSRVDRLPPEASGRVRLWRASTPSDRVRKAGRGAAARTSGRRQRRTPDCPAARAQAFRQCAQTRSAFRVAARPSQTGIPRQAAAKQDARDHGRPPRRRPR